MAAPCWASLNADGINVCVPDFDSRAWRAFLCEAWRSDRHLEVLGSAEGDLFAGLDFDRLTGRRIAAHAGSTIPHLQNSESDDLHPLGPLLVFGDQAYEVFHQLKPLLLGELMLLRQLIGQMLGGDRLWGRLGCHYWISHGRFCSLFPLCAMHQPYEFRGRAATQSRAGRESAPPIIDAPCH